MKFLRGILFCLSFFNVSAFVPIKLTFHKPTSLRSIHTDPDKPIVQNIIKDKSAHFLELIRYENILPTTALSIAGGWIANPSLDGLLHAPAFLTATVDTLLIMSSSMIINDLVDIPLDKINNPTRPLITGKVSVQEAITYLVALLSLAELLNFSYIPANFQNVAHLAILSILSYTPVLKHIFIVKNISCALLISFAVFFAGLTSSGESMPLSSIFINNRVALLYITSSLLFFGSLYTELLLDLCDVEGDKLHNIPTIPVMFGIKPTLNIVTILTTINIVVNSYGITYFYDGQSGVLFAFLSSHLLFQLKNIYLENFTKESIIKSVKNTTMPLVALLLYLCFLSTRG